MSAALDPRRDTRLPDLDILRAVGAGAREDFAILVRRHNQRLYRAVRAIATTDQDAEDVLQQVWLDIYRHAASFRGDAAFTTWATRIAINAALAHVRKRPALVEVRDDVAPEPPPDRTVERAELGALLERCLDTIPQGHREVVVLRDVLELDTAETAEYLGLTEEAVRVRLHRARAAVATAVSERMNEVYRFDGARCDRITARVMDAVTRSA